MPGAAFDRGHEIEAGGLGVARLDPVHPLDAAEQVAGAELDILQSLVEKSLVRFDEERYSLLETIREFAHERLAEAGELEEARRRHFDFYLALAAAEDTSAEAGYGNR